AALGDPLIEGTIEARFFIERQLPFVRHALRRLEQDQAVGRLFTIDTPAAYVFDDLLVVKSGIVAPEREVEAVSSLGAAVAGAGIAARLGQDGHDIPNETDRDCGRTISHCHGELGSQPTGRDLDRRLPVLDRLNESPVKTGGISGNLCFSSGR